MALHAIVGAGAIGTTTALLLAEAGEAERVRIVTRRGTGPDHPRIEKITADAADRVALTRAVSGAQTLFHCAAPPYHRWAADFPPLAESLLAAVEETGAGYVMLGNLYAYAPPSAGTGTEAGPVNLLTETSPLAPVSVKGQVRQRIWQQALDRARIGGVRVTEVRASDFIGPGARSFFTKAVAPGVLAGRITHVPADLDAPHSWSCTTDVARTLVAAHDERSWGRAWHVPSGPPQSVRQLAERLARLHGRPAPRLRSLPSPMLRAAGLFSADARELVELQYQFRRPFVLDSTLTEKTFGLAPTSVDEALRPTSGGTRP